MKILTVNVKEEVKVDGIHSENVVQYMHFTVILMYHFPIFNINKLLYFLYFEDIFEIFQICNNSTVTIFFLTKLLLKAVCCAF